MDNLFAEGLLQPVQCESVDAKTGWISVGVRREPKQETFERFEHLMSLVESSVPEDTARHGDWQRFAEIWAQLINVTCSVKHGGDQLRTSLASACIRELVDTQFTNWMLKRFGSLHNLPSRPPVMVHHITRHLAHTTHYKHRKDRIACNRWSSAGPVDYAARPDFR